jgi:hypothetical protein
LFGYQQVVKMKHSSFAIAAVAFAALAASSPIPLASSSTTGPINEDNSGRIAVNSGVITESGTGEVQVGTFSNGSNDFDNDSIIRRQQGSSGGDESTNKGNSGQIAANSGAVSGSGDTQVGDFGNGSNDFSDNGDSSSNFEGAFFRRQEGSSTSGGDSSTNEGNSGQIASNSGAVTNSGSGDTQVGDFGNGSDDFSGNGDSSFNADVAFFKRQEGGDSSTNEGNSGQISSNRGPVTNTGSGETQVGAFGNGADDFSDNDDSSFHVGIFRRQNGATNNNNNGQIAQNSGDITEDGGIVIVGNVAGSVTINLISPDGTKYSPQVPTAWTSTNQLTSSKWSAVSVPPGHQCNFKYDGGIYSYASGNHTFPRPVSLNMIKC